MSAGVYEGRVKWVGADSYSKDGGVRVKIDGCDEFFNVPGRFAAVFRKGAEVKVKLVQKGKKLFAENVKQLAAAQPEVERPSSNRASGSGGGVDWEKKDKSIQYQSSRKDAIELVSLLLANGALPLGSGKADSKAAIILGEVDRYTGKFFRDIATLGAVARDEEQRDEDPDVELDAGDSDDDFNDDPDFGDVDFD